MRLLDFILGKQKNRDWKNSLRDYQKTSGRQLINYKEDRFSKMIRETSFNPFNLTCDPAANKNLQFGDMVSIFKNELNSNPSNAKHYGMPLKEALKGYVFNMIKTTIIMLDMCPKQLQILL